MASKKPRRTLGKIVPPKLEGRSTVAPGLRTPEAGSIPARSIVVRKLGKILGSQGTTSAHRSCQHCEGSYIREMWIHSARCPWTVILWFGHGRTAADWTSPIYRTCPYRCPGEVLPSGVTHSWDCSWWNDSTHNPKQTTPIGLEAPP